MPVQIGVDRNGNPIYAPDYVTEFSSGPNPVILNQATAPPPAQVSNLPQNIPPEWQHNPEGYRIYLEEGARAQEIRRRSNLDILSAQQQARIQQETGISRDVIPGSGGRLDSGGMYNGRWVPNVTQAFRAEHPKMQEVSMGHQGPAPAGVSYIPYPSNAPQLFGHTIVGFTPAGNVTPSLSPVGPTYVPTGTYGGGGGGGAPSGGNNRVEEWNIIDTFLHPFNADAAVPPGQTPPQGNNTTQSWAIFGLVPTPTAGNGTPFVTGGKIPQLESPQTSNPLEFLGIPEIGQPTVTQRTTDMWTYPFYQAFHGAGQWYTENIARPYIEPSLKFISTKSEWNRDIASPLLTGLLVAGPPAAAEFIGMVPTGSEIIVRQTVQNPLAAPVFIGGLAAAGLKMQAEGVVQGLRERPVEFIGENLAVALIFHGATVGLKTVSPIGRGEYFLPTGREILIEKQPSWFSRTIFGSPEAGKTIPELITVKTFEYRNPISSIRKSVGIAPSWEGVKPIWSRITIPKTPDLALGEIVNTPTGRITAWGLQLPETSLLPVKEIGTTPGKLYNYSGFGKGIIQPVSSLRYEPPGYAILKGYIREGYVPQGPETAIMLPVLRKFYMPDYLGGSGTGTSLAMFDAGISGIKAMWGVKPQAFRSPYSVIENVKTIPKGLGSEVLDVFKRGPQDYEVSGSFSPASQGYFVGEMHDLDVYTNAHKWYAGEIGKIYKRGFGSDKIRTVFGEEGSKVQLQGEGDWETVVDLHNLEFGGAEGSIARFNIPMRPPIEIEGIRLMPLEEYFQRKVSATLYANKVDRESWTPAPQEWRPKEIADTIQSMTSEIVRIDLEPFSIPNKLRRGVLEESIARYYDSITRFPDADQKIIYGRLQSYGFLPPERGVSVPLRYTTTEIFNHILKGKLPSEELIVSVKIPPGLESFGGFERMDIAIPKKGFSVSREFIKSKPGMPLSPQPFELTMAQRIGLGVPEEVSLFTGKGKRVLGVSAIRTGESVGTFNMPYWMESSGQLKLFASTHTHPPAYYNIPGTSKWIRQGGWPMSGTDFGALELSQILESESRVLSPLGEGRFRLVSVSKPLAEIEKSISDMLPGHKPDRSGTNMLQRDYNARIDKNLKRALSKEETTYLKKLAGEFHGQWEINPQTGKFESAKRIPSIERSIIYKQGLAQYEALQAMADSGSIRLKAWEHSGGGWEEVPTTGLRPVVEIESRPFYTKYHNTLKILGKARHDIMEDYIFHISDRVFGEPTFGMKSFSGNRISRLVSETAELTKDYSKVVPPRGGLTHGIFYPPLITKLGFTSGKTFASSKIGLILYPSPSRKHREPRIPDWIVPQQYSGVKDYTRITPGKIIEGYPPNISRTPRVFIPEYPVITPPPEKPPKNPVPGYPPTVPPPKTPPPITPPPEKPPKNPVPGYPPTTPPPSGPPGYPPTTPPPSGPPGYPPTIPPSGKPPKTPPGYPPITPPGKTTLKLPPSVTEISYPPTKTEVPEFNIGVYPPTTRTPKRENYPPIVTPHYPETTNYPPTQKYPPTVRFPPTPSYPPTTRTPTFLFPPGTSEVFLSLSRPHRNAIEEAWEREWFKVPRHRTPHVAWDITNVVPDMESAFGVKWAGLGHDYGPVMPDLVKPSAMMAAFGKMPKSVMDITYRKPKRLTKEKQIKEKRKMLRSWQGYPL